MVHRHDRLPKLEDAIAITILSVNEDPERLIVQSITRGGFPVVLFYLKPIAFIFSPAPVTTVEFSSKTEQLSEECLSPFGVAQRASFSVVSPQRYMSQCALHHQVESLVYCMYGYLGKTRRSILSHPFQQCLHYAQNVTH